MTMRDELIEAAARADCQRVMRLLNPTETQQETTARVTAAWRLHIDAATAALDAILERMKEPDEAMVIAGGEAAGRQVFSAYPIGKGFAGFKPTGSAVVWTAMLATLSPPPALT